MGFPITSARGSMCHMDEDMSPTRRAGCLAVLGPWAWPFDGGADVMRGLVLGALCGDGLRTFSSRYHRYAIAPCQALSGWAYSMGLILGARGLHTSHTLVACTPFLSVWDRVDKPNFWASRGAFSLSMRSWSGEDRVQHGSTYEFHMMNTIYRVKH